MMNIELDIVCKLAKALTPPVEMAALLGVDELLLQEELQNRDSNIRKVYLKGLAETAQELRRQMIDAARAGSPSAVEQAVAALNECKI